MEQATPNCGWLIAFERTLEERCTPEGVWDIPPSLSRVVEKRSDNRLYKSACLNAVSLQETYCQLLDLSSPIHNQARGPAPTWHNPRTNSTPKVVSVIHKLQKQEWRWNNSSGLCTPDINNEQIPASLETNLRSHCTTNTLVASVTWWLKNIASVLEICL